MCVHNEQFPGQAIFGPLHVHGRRAPACGAVMVLNQTRPAGQGENVVVGQHIALAQGNARRMPAAGAAPYDAQPGAETGDTRSAGARPRRPTPMPSAVSWSLHRAVRIRECPGAGVVVPSWWHGQSVAVPLRLCGDADTQARETSRARLEGRHAPRQAGLPLPSGGQHAHGWARGCTPWPILPQRLLDKLSPMLTGCC